MTTPPVTSAPSALGPSFLDYLPASGLPKKRHTWIIVLVVTLALMLVGFVGWVAIIASTGKAKGARDEGEAPPPPEQRPSAMPPGATSSKSAAERAT